MMHDNPQRTREIFLFGGFYKWKRISSVDVNFKIQFKCDEAPVKPFYLYKYTNFICREADHLSCSTTKNSCCLPLKFCFIQSVAVVLQSFPDFRFVFFSWAPIFCQVLVLENSFTALKFCPNLYFLLRPFRKVSCLPLQTAVLFTGLLAQSPQILFYPTANSAVCVKRSFTNQGRKVHKLERMVMWVFGYASLVWKPGFEYDEKLVGFIKGHRRVFNLACIEHRGTPAFPARTCTLEAQEGAICWGTAYSVSGGPEEEKAAIEYLARRECEYDVQDYVDFYQETNPETPLLTGVLVFTSTPDKIANKYFLGSAPFEEMASQIAKAVGPCGNNREYLFKLEKALYDIGHEDAEVIELANEVRRITSSEIDLGAIDDPGITSFEMDNHEIDLEAIDDHESTSSEIDNHETDLEDIDDPEVTSSETDNREIDLGAFNDHEIKSSEIDNVIPMEQTSFCLPNSYKQFLIAAPESF